VAVCEPADLVGRLQARDVAGLMTDADRERLIDSCRTILECAVEREWKVWAAGRMRELIAGRSPQRIEQMETERGLRVS
jgi:hypothetical protein